jgi:hypothetical protein
MRQRAKQIKRRSNNMVGSHHWTGGKVHGDKEVVVGARAASKNVNSEKREPLWANESNVVDDPDRGSGEIGHQQAFEARVRGGTMKRKAKEGTFTLGSNNRHIKVA